MNNINDQAKEVFKSAVALAIRIRRECGEEVSKQDLHEIFERHFNQLIQSYGGGNLTPENIQIRCYTVSQIYKRIIKSIVIPFIIYLAIYLIYVITSQSLTVLLFELPKSPYDTISTIKTILLTSSAPLLIASIIQPLLVFFKWKPREIEERIDLFTQLINEISKKTIYSLLFRIWFVCIIFYIVISVGEKNTSFQSYTVFNEIFYYINRFLIVPSLFVKRIYDIEKSYSQILANRLGEQGVQSRNSDSLYLLRLLVDPIKKYEFTITAIFLFFMPAFIAIILPFILKP